MGTIKADEILRQLGWHLIKDWKSENKIWYAFCTPKDPGKIEITMDEAEENDDAYYVYLQKEDTEIEELNPFWRLHAEAKKNGYSELCFEEIEAFYKKIKELRKENKESNKRGENK